jgi:hypothetical protein
VDTPKAAARARRVAPRVGASMPQDATRNSQARKAPDINQKGSAERTRATVSSRWMAG